MSKFERSVNEVTVHVKGNHFTVTPEIRTRAETKMRRLQRYLDRLSSIEVEMCHEATRDTQHKNHVEVIAHARGKLMRVTSMHSDMAAALDEAIDKLYRQLVRQKELTKAHTGPRLAEILVAEDVGEAVEAEPDEPVDEPVIHLKRVDLEPRFEDEAIAEFEDSGRSCYMFLNAATEQINVLYREADNALTLVQPSR